MKSKSKVSEFLASPRAKRRCRTCDDVPLAIDVRAFLDARSLGNKHTWHEFYHQHVRANYPEAPGETSMRRHVELCLRRDATTGKAL